MYEVALLGSVAVFVGVIFYYLNSGLASIYHPLSMYIAFHGFIFVFRPIYVYFTGYDYVYHVYHFMPSVGDKVTVIAASSIGLVSFAYFSMRAGNIPMRFRDDDAHRVERQLIRRIVPTVLAICIPLGIYSLSRAANVAVTGESTMVLKDNIRVNTTDVGYLTEAVLLLVPSTALIAWFWRFSLPSLLPLLMFFVFKASTGGRGAFVVAAFATALLYFYDKKTRLPSLRAFAITLVVGSVFTVIGVDRGYALREALGFENKTQDYSNTNLRFLEGQDFANMEYFEFIVHVVPEKSGTYDYFLNNLMLFTEPVPRVLWPGKPAGAPIKMIDWFRYGTPLGMTSSLPGLGWIQLGWFGVILWCGLWGWALGRFYRWFAGGPQAALHVALYLVFFSLLIIGFRDGGLVTLARQGIFLLGPIGMLVALRRFSKIPSLDVIELMLARRAAPRAAAAVQGVSAAANRALPRSRRKRLAAAGQPTTTQSA